MNMIFHRGIQEMARKGKQTRVNVKMQSTKSPHYYTTTTNPKNNFGKLELKKFDPTLNKVVVYKQARKIK
jgi:large subunit ribosomal protein L33